MAMARTMQTGLMLILLLIAFIRRSLGPRSKGFQKIIEDIVCQAMTCPYCKKIQFNIRYLNSRLR